MFVPATKYSRYPHKPTAPPDYSPFSGRLHSKNSQQAELATVEHIIIRYILSLSDIFRNFACENP